MLAVQLCPQVLVVIEIPYYIKSMNTFEWVRVHFLSFR